jgi:transposase
MHKEAREELRVRFKLVILELASHFGVRKICQEYNVPRSTFYGWKKKYDQEGKPGLYRKKPVAHRHPRKTSPELLRKSWNFAKIIKLEPCGLRIIWTATTGSRYRNPL